MKLNPFLICVVLLLIGSVTPSNAQSDRIVNLKGKWLFQLGDNKKYAESDYNDSDWEEINVPATWQRQGFSNYSGYAWYRKTFELDNNVKSIHRKCNYNSNR